MSDQYAIATTTGFVLRDYQKAAVDAAVQCIRGPKDHNGLLILPTGSGKSLVIANIVKEVGEPCLVLQPTKEILAQNVEKYRSYGFPCGVWSASAGEKRMGNVTFAMIGSLIKKKHLVDRFKYVLVDECHLVNSKTKPVKDDSGNVVEYKSGMYAELLNHMGCQVIGLTATPYRLGSDANGQAVLKFLTRTQPRIFNKVLYFVQNGRLFEDGHLAKLVYHSVEAIHRQNLQTNSTGSDYTDQSVQAEYRASGFHAKVVKVVNRLFEVGRKNVLVFTRFTEEAAYVVRNVPGAAIVTAETPTKERDRVIEGFKAGRIRCVCNVGILTTGFDYPELEAVVLARPTKSLGLYYQMIGRCIRPHPDKTHSMVIDMGGNMELFGKVEDMVLSPEGGWHVQSNGRQLTNVAFGQQRKYFPQRH